MFTSCRTVFLVGCVVLLLVFYFENFHSPHGMAVHATGMPGDEETAPMLQRGPAYGHVAYSDHEYKIPVMSNSAYCDDNVQCFNGGYCDPVEHVCVCPKGFTDANCSTLECANGGHGPNEEGICECAAGWSGPNCLMCTTDRGCQDAMNTTYSNTTSFCDTTYYTNNRKYFFCEILSEDIIEMVGNVSTMTCDNVSTTTEGICTAQFFATNTPDFPRGVRKEVFFCNFMSCKAVLDAHDDAVIQYACEKTNCKCTGQTEMCNENVEYIVDRMKGKALVDCNNVTKECTMTQVEFPAAIPLYCYGGECMSRYVPPPPPPPDISWIYMATAGGVALILAIILTAVFTVTVFFSSLHTRKVTAEYKMIQYEPHGASLQFKNLSYYLKVKQNGTMVNKKLLKDVSHYIRPGSVLALMGASGAGKSTLLDILANRNKQGKITGEILVNGKPIDASYKRLSGYVFQDDNLMGTMTVEECLRFSADLRLPDCVTKDEKTTAVHAVMKDLGIDHIADRRVGDALSRGISGGEKRRVSIGMELVTSPHILFLDEPTSGLDSHSAVQVVQCLRKLAEKGRTIVFSIHQPRSNIFAQFDEILLLNKGHIAYAGPAQDAVSYFEKLGFNCPKNFNPADYVIDVLAQDEGLVPIFTNQPKTSNTLKVERSTYGSMNTAKSPVSPSDDYYSAPSTPYLEGEHTDEEVPSMLEDESPIYEGKLIPHATSFFSQLVTLSRRAFLNFIRNFFLMPAHYISSIVVGLLLGCIYFQLDTDLDGCQNRIGVIFFMCSILCFTAMSSLELFITERAIYVREKANGYYYPMSYYFSKVFFDLIPLRIVPPLLMGGVAYFMVGLHSTVSNFIWFMILMILFNLVSGGMCILIGAIAPTVASGNVIATLAILCQSLFAGFLVNKGSMPTFLSWLQYFSFWNYSFEALMINEFYNIDIYVNPKGAQPFPAKGTFILNQLRMDHTRFYMDVIITAIFAVLYIVTAGVLLRTIREKR